MTLPLPLASLLSALPPSVASMYVGLVKRDERPHPSSLSGLWTGEFVDSQGQIHMQQPAGHPDSQGAGNEGAREDTGVAV